MGRGLAKCLAGIPGGRGFEAFTSYLPPGGIAAHVLPKTLQPPDHVELAVREVFEEAVTHQPDHILPVVIPFVGELFLQHGPDGNDRGKGIAENHKLQKKFPAQNTEPCRQRNGHKATQFDRRSQKFEEPQIGKREPADPAVARPEEHVAVLPEHVEQPLLPAGALPRQRAQVAGHLCPTDRVGNEADVIVGAPIASASFPTRSVGQRCPATCARWRGNAPAGKKGCSMCSGKTATCSSGRATARSAGSRFPICGSSNFWPL